MSDHAIDDASGEEVKRRDFLHIASTALMGAGAVCIAWPVIDQMNPAANVLAFASTEVDLSPIELGQTVKVVWRGKPVYIRHRTEEQIKVAEAVPMADLKDPQTDEARVQKPQWLVIVGICTHLGCIPISDPDAHRGKYGGWFCPCHGSDYDGSGRIRKGPAPKNMAVPPYKFLTDTSILIG